MKFKLNCCKCEKEFIIVETKVKPSGYYVCGNCWRDCLNCKYEKINILEEPCITCDNNNSKWERV